jgi:hypothetical protein
LKTIIKINFHFFFLHLFLLDLIASWENLLKWSDNAAVARRLQEEMSVLKAALQNFGLQFHGFDSEESIRDAIEDLKVSF